MFFILFIKLIVKYHKHLKCKRCKCLNCRFHEENLRFWTFAFRCRFNHEQEEENQRMIDKFFEEHESIHTPVSVAPPVAAASSPVFKIPQTPTGRLTPVLNTRVAYRSGQPSFSAIPPALSSHSTPPSHSAIPLHQTPHFA